MTISEKKKPIKCAEIMFSFQFISRVRIIILGFSSTSFPGLPLERGWVFLEQLCETSSSEIFFVKSQPHLILLNNIYC